MKTRIPWADAIRWVASALLVFSLFGFGLWWLVFAPVATDESFAGEPVVEIDLQAEPSAPSASSDDLPPGPPQPSPEQSAIDGAKAPQHDPEPEKPPPDPPPADAGIPMPLPKPVEPPARVAQAVVPPPSASPSVSMLVTPSVGASPGQREEAKRAIAAWQRLLVARLERAKRYPAAAEGRDGATTISFSIDRAGHLTAHRIVNGAGVAALDEATLDLLRRSAPFTPPPPQLSDTQLTFVVTIRYRR